MKAPRSTSMTTPLAHPRLPSGLCLPDHRLPGHRVPSSGAVRHVPSPSRRSFLQEVGAYASKGTAAALAAGPLASLAGCASLIGEHTVDAFVVVLPVNGQFGGWTEIGLDTPAGPDDSATLVRVALRAPPGHEDLTFITSLTGNARDPAGGPDVPIVKGGNFPKGDSLGLMEILFFDNLQPLFKDGLKIRIEWRGTADTSIQYPKEGLRCDASVTVEVG